MLLREQAHAIKGVASNLGLVRVAFRSGEVMHMADWQLKSEWKERMKQIRAAVKEGRQALAARMHPSAVTGDSDIDIG